MTESNRHGLCECRQGCQCENTPGPVAYEVVRESGVVQRVCTRCTLSSDQEQQLLVTKEDRAMLYIEYDALGFMSIVFDLADEPEEQEALH